MSNTALNRTSIALLTNKSGGAVAQGDVVIVDSANASAFTTNSAGSYVSGSIGVVMEPNGIASNAIGTVAFGGYVPIVNLSSSASLGDVFHTHTVAKQALRHAAPIVAGDFGQVLATGTTPAAFLWGQPASAVAASTTGAELGYAQITAEVDVAADATYHDITGLSLTVTVPSSGVLITAQINNVVTHSGLVQGWFFGIFDTTGSTLVQQIHMPSVDTQPCGGTAIARLIPGAGSRSYKVQVFAGGGGSIGIAAVATSPSFIRATAL